MKKLFNIRPLGSLTLLLLSLTLIMTACGDSTDSLTIGAASTTQSTTITSPTIAPATTSAATTAAPTTPAATTNLPTTAPATTQLANTQPPATTAAPATTPTPINITTPPNTMPIFIAAPTTAAPVVTNAPPPATKNGNKLVFDVLNTQTNESRIFTINTDGSNKTDIGPGQSPIFSPDGQQIAYLVSTGQINSPITTTYTIYSMNLDGSNKQKYCTTPAGKYTTLLSWSPRSRFFALRLATAGTEDLGSIYTCSLSSKTLSQYKIGKDTVPRVFDWSPSGDDAVWMENSDSPEQEVLDLFYGDPDKTKAEATNVTNGQYKAGFLGNLSLYYSARISPDGKTILIQGERVFFVSVPGQQSPLAGQSFDAEFGYNFAWSPDSQSLAYVKPLEGSSELRIVSVAGGKIGQPVILDNTIAGSVDWARK